MDIHIFMAVIKLDIFAAMDGYAFGGYSWDKKNQVCRECLN